MPARMAQTGSHVRSASVRLVHSKETRRFRSRRDLGHATASPLRITDFRTDLRHSGEKTLRDRRVAGHGKLEGARSGAMPKAPVCMPGHDSRPVNRRPLTDERCRVRLQTESETPGGSAAPTPVLHPRRLEALVAAFSGRGIVWRIQAPIFVSRSVLRL